MNDESRYHHFMHYTEFTQGNNLYNNIIFFIGILELSNVRVYNILYSLIKYSLKINNGQDLPGKDDV